MIYRAPRSLPFLPLPVDILDADGSLVGQLVYLRGHEESGDAFLNQKLLQLGKFLLLDNYIKPKNVNN